jgi:predicted nucleic acid-binding protein
VKTVFVDTGGFFALYVRNDSFHKRARALFETASKERWQFYTTNSVVLEAYALFLARARRGRDLAITFLDDLAATQVKVERVTEEDERAAVALVRKHEDKTYSLCDAQSFIVMKRLGIEDAMACDDDFASYGQFNLLA